MFLERAIVCRMVLAKTPGGGFSIRYASSITVEVISSLARKFISMVPSSRVTVPAIIFENILVNFSLSPLISVTLIPFADHFNKNTSKIRQVNLINSLHMRTIITQLALRGNLLRPSYGR